MDEVLNRVSLVDDLKAGEDEVEVETPELEGLAITWFDNDRELGEMRNKRSISKSLIRSGKVKVRVEFKTDEIRKKSDVLRDEETLRL